MNSTCYVYEIVDELTGKWYIGSRTAKGCRPEELGVTYFTSSKVVSPLYKSNPGRFKSKILVVSDSTYVVKTEAKLLEFRGAKADPNSYNMSNGGEKMNPFKAGKLAGSITGPMMAEQKKGVCAPGVANLAGAATYLKKKGIHAPGGYASGGSAAGKKLYRCLTCGKVSTPGAIGNHVAYTKHSGVEFLKVKEE